jgi:predicted MFS family arabinose efflux permease
MKIQNFGAFFAFSIIGTVTLMPLLVLPAMVGVLVDNAAMSESSAGFSASANFMASAVVGLILSVRMHHVNIRQLSAIVFSLAIFADVMSAFTAGETATFFAARIAAGLMLGAAYAACVAAFARIDGYERGFGLFVTIQFIVSGIGLYVVPVYADVLGAKGLFLLFAVGDFIALLLSRFLPSQIVATGGHEKRQSEFAVLLKYSALMAIVGFAIFEAANNAQFAFVERFGVALNISDHEIGVSLLVASLVGIPGAFCIVLVGSRFGTLQPLIFGISIGIAGMLVLINSSSYAWYFFGSCCMGFSWAFCLPFIQSLLAAIDRHGSAIAAGSSFSTLGSAAGPGIAAVIVVGGRYSSVFVFSIALFLVTVTLFVLAEKMRRQNK